VGAQIKRGARKQRLLEFENNCLCTSVRGSELYSPLKVFLEPLYDPTHSLWISLTGSPCRFMIDHGQRHVMNVFRYATRLYYSTVCDQKNPYRNREFLKEDVDRVCLIVSIWLHDWGMMGPLLPTIPFQLLSFLEDAKAHKTYLGKCKEELNEFFESASRKLGEKFDRIEHVDKDIDCQWIRPKHALITYFNIVKANQTIGLDKLCQNLENYGRGLEDIATICLFHSFPLRKMKEFGKESLSGLSALLAFLDGCDENWQRLVSMKNVDTLASQGFLEGCKIYEKINSVINSESLYMFLLSEGITEDSIQRLRDAWNKERLKDVDVIISDLQKTCRNKEELATLRGDVKYYRENFIDKSKMHFERKMVIDDVYFKNGEIILVPRHKLIDEKNPAVQKTIEVIKKHLKSYSDGLKKLGLPFNEKSVRLWRPEDGDPEHLEIPETNVAPIVDKSILCSVTPFQDLDELVKNGNFIERPLKENEEWKLKKVNLISFDPRLTEDAMNKLKTNRILLITGSQNVGKSSFLLYLLDECLALARSKVADWEAIFFLNPFINEKELDLVLENLNTIIQSEYRRDSVLLAVDGLRRRETDENYVNKCLKLFRKASEYGYRLVATVRDDEKEYLKNKLGPNERGIDEWTRFDPGEIRIAYRSGELEQILLRHLNYYREKIRLEYVTYEEMSKFPFAEDALLEKDDHRRFKYCVETAVRKSEGLAGYIAFLIEEILEHEHEFSMEVIDKYPVGMVNLVLNTLWRDYYVEENEKVDQLIPLLLIFLTKLESTFESSLTKHFFDSFKAWGIDKLDAEFSEENKDRIREKIGHIIDFYTVRTSFVQENEYRLLNYWNEAIDKAVCEDNFDEKYRPIVNILRNSEKNWKYLMSDYINFAINDLSGKSFDHYLPYLVADLAKLSSITETDILKFAVDFFKKNERIHGKNLPLQFDFLRLELSLSLRLKAQGLFEKSNFDRAIDHFKMSVDIDDQDFRAYWGIGECYEKKAQNREALNWYAKSASKQNTGRGYGALVDKIKEYLREFGLPPETRFECLELQEAAARKAIECERNDHIAWGMLGDSLLSQGKVLERKKEYRKAISRYETAIRTYKEALGILVRMKLRPKDLYYWQIAYCHDGLKSAYTKLNEPKAQPHVSEAIKYATHGAELENCAEGYLQLALFTSGNDYFREDSSVCKVALGKIKPEDLTEKDLIKYYYALGLNHENRKEFDDAIESFERSRKLIFLQYSTVREAEDLKREEKTLSRMGDIYQHIGDCLAELGDYEKAAENYMTYVGLNEYTPKGVSGKIFGIFGNRLLRMGIYESAYYCFRNALKRDPTNIQNLDQMAIVNERMGKLEYAISNLEKVVQLGRQSRGIPAQNQAMKLDKLRQRLKRMNEIASILLEVCDVADLVGIQGEETPSLSEKLFNIYLSMASIDSRVIDASPVDLDELRTSLCRQSFMFDMDGPAKAELERIARAHGMTTDKLKSVFNVKFNISRAQEASEDGSFVLEIIHRVFATAFNTLKVADLIRRGTLVGNERQERIQRLSEEWGKTGRRISKIPVGGIQHPVAIRCYQLSLKFGPENVGSWCNLGWMYFYDATKWGDSYDLRTLEKAHDAFNKSLEVAERGRREYTANSKIGIGKVYEAKGDVQSAAKLFKEAANLWEEQFAQDSKKIVDNLTRTADSLRDLRLRGLAKDEEMIILKDALDLYKRASEISQRTGTLDSEATLIREKTLLFESQVKTVGARLREVEEHFPKLAAKPRKSIDELIRSPSRNGAKKISDIVLQLSQKPDDYGLFKQLLRSEFGCNDKLSESDNLIVETLDHIVSLSLKQATRDSPFEVPAQIFHSCEVYCKDMYGERVRQEFISLFNQRMVVRFAKIVLGIEYQMGPIKSEEELGRVLHEFDRTFARFGAKLPSLDEISQAIESKKRRGQVWR